MGFELPTLQFSKISTIVLLDDELVRMSTPAAEIVVRDELLSAIVQFEDQQFIDSTVTASAGVHPASITNGAPSVASTGSTVAEIVADVKTMYAIAVAANIPFLSPAFIMNPRTAIYLSTGLTAGNISMWPTIGPRGGTWFNVPVIVSANVPIESRGWLRNFPCRRWRNYFRRKRRSEHPKQDRPADRRAVGDVLVAGQYSRPPRESLLLVDAQARGRRGRVNGCYVLAWSRCRARSRLQSYRLGRAPGRAMVPTTIAWSGLPNCTMPDAGQENLFLRSSAIAMRCKSVAAKIVDAVYNEVSARVAASVEARLAAAVKTVELRFSQQAAYEKSIVGRVDDLGRSLDELESRLRENEWRVR
jgi:hypothetical protein